jgi:protein arginine N-methyltransferase 1
MNSFRLTLPDKADIVICDHVGYFGFDYSILGLLADARQRFLHQDGITIPTEIDLQLAPVESDECHKLVGQWHDGSVPAEFRWVGSISANTKHAVSVDESALLAEAATLATLPLGVQHAPYLAWSAEFDALRNGRLDGVAGWFDCQLFDNIRMNNSPRTDDALQRPKAFLPLEAPVQVKSGERIKVTIMNRHLDHVIGWVVELPDSGKRFAQNTFNGLLLDRDSLVRAHPERIARLNDLGEARKIVLSFCDGKRTLAEVQKLVAAEYPTLFPSSQATYRFVTAVLASDTIE